MSLLVLPRLAHESCIKVAITVRGVLSFTHVVDNDTTVHDVHTHTVAFSPSVLIKCIICSKHQTLTRTPHEWLKETVIFHHHFSILLDFTSFHYTSHYDNVLYFIVLYIIVLDYLFIVFVSTRLFLRKYYNIVSFEVISLDFDEVQLAFGQIKP